MKNYIIHKGIHYYDSYNNARKRLRILMERYPEVRIVQYELGYAIQYYKSGPYFPEMVHNNDPFAKPEVTK